MGLHRNNLQGIEYKLFVLKKSGTTQVGISQVLYLYWGIYVQQGMYYTK